MITIEKIWLNKSELGTEIRFDWSNDRHHSVCVEYPCGAEQIAIALRDVSWLIAGDPYLAAPNNEVRGAKERSS